MDVTISRALIDELLRLADAEPTSEVCGLLFGEGARIDAIQPCANVAGDSAQAFEIDPAALIAAHKQARAGGAQLVGCYHSHPNGRCAPSAYDIAAVAGDIALWAIIAAGEVGFWHADAPQSLQAGPRFAKGNGVQGI